MRANQITGSVPAKNHIGWGCKLYSTAGVMEWLSDRYSPEISSIPARKRDKWTAGVSLRQLMKQKYQSATGEINNAQDLASVAREQKNIVASVIDCQNQEDYFRIIISAIDNNLAPIVFFDVGDDGFPICAQGGKEHAAVVTGYYYDALNNLKFTLLQWEQQYNVDAAELYQSTQQLNVEATNKLFVKTKNRRGEGAWFPGARIQEFFPHHFPVICNARSATSPSNNQGFKNKILLLDVDMPVKIQKLIADLNGRVTKIKKDKGVLAQAKIVALQELQAKLNKGLTSKESLFALVQEWKSTESQDDLLKNNWEIISEHRYQGCFSFFNPKKTATQKLLDEVFSNPMQMLK